MKIQQGVRALLDRLGLVFGYRRLLRCVGSTAECFEQFKLYGELIDVKGAVEKCRKPEVLKPEII